MSNETQPLVIQTDQIRTMRPRILGVESGD